MSRIEATENQILNSVCEYLTLHKYFFWRNNNVAIYDKSRGVFRRMPKYAKKGVADIIMIDKGICYGLEIKKDKGIQSKEQKKFENDFINAGGKYYVIRSIDDVVSLGF